MVPAEETYPDVFRFAVFSSSSKGTGSMRRGGAVLALLLSSLGTSAGVSGQMAICTTPHRPECPATLARLPEDEFTFSRLMFADNQRAIDNLGDHIGYPHWQADCSESEPHFIAALKRLTNIDTNDDSQSISLFDERVFDYPMLYVVEAGFASFTRTEIDRLREYLLRGGFLLVDDFHGDYQWSQFENWMSKVFPDRPIVDLPPDHEIFDVHFRIEDFVQIPGLRALCLNPGETWELPIRKSMEVGESNTSRQLPKWRGVLDDEGRVMVVINWNMDLGDAWEHADMEEYRAQYTATAYRLGVNYLIYGMTH
ncbi:MAG: hypothetical protein CSB44_04275 [Gammaproteobacteria bacterium]|nr:MAG: hypothetical protein CSB44_04275 [Gammaproteobacteria bacterium]